MNTKTFKNAFRSVAISQIFAYLVAYVANTIDTSITGKYLGGDAVACIGYSLPLILFYNAIATLISFGTQTCCSKYIGEGDTKRASGQYTMALIASLVISGLFLGAVCIFPRGFAVVLGAQGEKMIAMTADYLVGLAYGVPPIFIFMLFTPLCNLDGNTKLPIIAVLTLIAVDICFDILNATVIKGGIYGMGVASSMSYVVSALIIITHAFTKKCSFKLKLKNIEAAMIKKTCLCGLPTAIQGFGLACLNVLINFLLTDGESTLAMSTFSIGYCIMMMVLSIANGLAPAVVSFAGVFYGEEDKESLKILQKEALKISIIWNIVAFAITWLAARPLIGIFTNESEIIEMTMIALPLLCTQLVFYCIDICFQNYLMVIGNEKLIIVMSFMSNFVFCAVCALAFNGLWGTTGIWLCYIGGKFLSVLALLIIAIIKNKGIPRTKDEWLLLPKNFAANKITEVSFNIEKSEDVLEASQRAWAFCSDNGADKKTRYIISLFVEEIGNNCVSHGFSKKKNNQLGICLINYTDCWKLRLRDNGKLFDPIKYLELHKDSDLGHNIGIKLATGMAKDIQYLSTFSLNNIILTINK